MSAGSARRGSSPGASSPMAGVVRPEPEPPARFQSLHVPERAEEATEQPRRKIKSKIRAPSDPFLTLQQRSEQLQDAVDIFGDLGELQELFARRDAAAEAEAEYEVDEEEEEDGVALEDEDEDALDRLISPRRRAGRNAAARARVAERV